MHFSKQTFRTYFGVGLIALAVLVAGVPSSAHAETFYREMELGMTGSDISTLQSYLATDATLYPQGLVTGYFGALTKAAVARFQTRNGISAVGRVGPITLALLNLRVPGGVAQGTDVYAPTIIALQANASRNGATVNWSTSEASRGKLYYSSSPIQIRNTFDETGLNFVEPTVSGTLAPYDGGIRTAQTVTISNLVPNSVYYYEVVALDGSNNSSISLPAYFRTTN